MPILKAAVVGIKRFLFSYDWGVIEMQGAAFKILWGLWAIQGFAMFKTVSVFTVIASEEVWAVFLLVFGSLHIIAVMSHRLIFRQMMTFLAFIFWVFTIVLVYQQSHTSALIPFFCVIALFMGLNFLRLGLDTEYIVSIEKRKGRYVQ